LRFSENDINTYFHFSSHEQKSAHWTLSQNSFRNNKFIKNNIINMTKATMIGTSAVSKQGQITIPKVVRNRLKLNKGDIVEFLLTTENLLIIKKSDYDVEIEI